MDLAPLCPLWLIPQDRCPSLSCFLLGRSLPAAWIWEPLVREKRWGERACRVCGKKELQTCLWSEALLSFTFQHKPKDTNAKRQGCISCDGCCVGAAVRGAAAGSCLYILSHPWIYSVLSTVAAVSSIHYSVCQPCFFFGLTFSSHWSILGFIFSSLDTELNRGTSLNPPSRPFLTYLWSLSMCLCYSMFVCA